MFRAGSLFCSILLMAAFIAGCQTKSSPPATGSSAQKSHDDHDGHHGDGGGHNVQMDEAGEAKVSAVLAKLSPEDRQLAESQRFCAVMSRERLGRMGTPIKLDLKGQAVFVCCKGCKPKALKHPDDTLAKVAEMKSHNQPAQP